MSRRVRSGTCKASAAAGQSFGCAVWGAAAHLLEGAYDRRTPPAAPGAARREARGSRARLAVDSIRGTWLREREPLPAEQLDAGLGHLRVVETAAVLLDLLERRVDAQGRAVGPVRGHGLDHVGHGEDARLEDDLVAGKAPRVAGAVEALVVLQGHLGL